MRFSHPGGYNNDSYFTPFRLPLWKRIFDILFSLTAIFLLSPLMLLTLLAVKLESKGPAIYTSSRAGVNYKVFGFLKFRSMYSDADKRLSEFKALNQYQDISSNDVISDKKISDDDTSFDDIKIRYEKGEILFIDNNKVIS